MTLSGGRFVLRRGETRITGNGHTKQLDEVSESLRNGNDNEKNERYMALLVAIVCGDILQRTFREDCHIEQ